jgi:hypothetical protein
MTLFIGLPGRVLLRDGAQCTKEQNQLAPKLAPGRVAVGASNPSNPSVNSQRSDFIRSCRS